MAHQLNLVAKPSGGYSKPSGALRQLQGIQGLGLGGDGGLCGHGCLGRLGSSLCGLLGAGESHQLAAVPVAVIVAPAYAQINTAQQRRTARK